MDPRDLPAEVLAFLRERHLATLTTLRADGSPHVVPVGFSFDPDAVRGAGDHLGRSVKARNAGARRPRRGVAGRRRPLADAGGPGAAVTDPDGVAAAVAGYTERYRPPKQRDDRVAIEIAVDKVMGRA
jgi:F420H(2)-dependent biliverdin reductase